MKKTALALGGGAVLGAAHVGVLRAVSELDIHLSMVSGTSIGAFIAALYAFGKSWEEIRDIALAIDWVDLSGLALSQFGLLSNKKFGTMVTDLLGKRDIRDARIPLSIVATDIGAGRKFVFTEGDVAMAVMASSCIPGVFKPVDYHGVLLVDGVLMENVPVSPLIEGGAESVICVDLLASHCYKKPDNIIDLLLNAFYSTIINTTALQIADADLSILPDLSGFSLLDVSQVPDLMDAGYRAALPVLSGWAGENR
ncbi:patatin-like phospholipase family protein [Chlorobium sp. KB01]|uniref:patatin-like phospholipase family protein n=2 Tax=Chlorobium TaxID=1091 RepID=UPI000977C437|nr:patatin-like phospholipase family protein [Chlorobium sp. KB01]